MKKVGWSSILVAAILLAVAVIAEAQQPKKDPRIGYFLAAEPLRRAGSISRHSGKGLRDLGYVEGKNIGIEFVMRGKAERFPDLSPSWFVSRWTSLWPRRDRDPRPPNEATTTIPIVMATSATIRVGAGSSPASRGPGENHRADHYDPELSGKRLELLREVVPGSPASPSSGIRRPRRLALAERRRTAPRSPSGCSFNPLKWGAPRTSTGPSQQ